MILVLPLLKIVTTLKVYTFSVQEKFYVEYCYTFLKRFFQAGAVVNSQRMKDGWTPLYLAVIFGYVYKVQYLIDHGADVLLADEMGWSVMDWANKYSLPGRTICVK